MAGNDYSRIKRQSYDFYQKIKFVQCPYFKSKIIFSAGGFWHLIYTGRNKKRDQQTQILRFGLLPKAVKLLKLTTTLQEYEERKRNDIKYFGFIAILDNCKIKVVVKKSGNGAYHFWSVMPNWVTSPKRDRVLHKGDMQID